MAHSAGRSRTRHAGDVWMRRRSSHYPWPNAPMSPTTRAGRRICGVDAATSGGLALFDNPVAAIAALRRKGRGMNAIAGHQPRGDQPRDAGVEIASRQGTISAQAGGVVSGAASTTDRSPGASAWCVSG